MQLKVLTSIGVNFKILLKLEILFYFISAGYEYETFSPAFNLRD